MKKVVLMLSIISISTLVLYAGDVKVVGDWDCEAYVDMSYPFARNITEKEGKLSGMIVGDEGNLDLQAVSYKEGKLKFQFEYPPVLMAN